jgi:hypothetical protein
MAVNISELKVGDKVHYQPSYSETWQNGRVKEIPEENFNSVRVVYNCAGEWENFMDYTSQLTAAKDLFLGWKH